MKAFLAMAAVAALLAGCSQTRQPIVDTKGVDNARYSQDESECQQYAEQVSPVGDAAVGAVGGAAGGAALGAITGALVPGMSAGTGAAVGAGTGGLLGLGGGAAVGVSEQREVFRNCMKGRGYSVLN